MNIRIIKERFEEKYIPEPNSGCWLWLACLDQQGYGRFRFKNKFGIKRSYPAYRAAFELYRGGIPSGLELDHLCRVRCCVNPWHLEPVTHTENIKRGKWGFGRGQQQKNKTHCPKGHPYSGENLYVYKGERYCRECRRINDRDKYWRDKAKSIPTV